MSILPKKKHQPTKDEQIEESKVKIKDLQMSLKRTIRALLRKAETLEESRKAAEERDYKDIENGLSKQIDYFRSFITYFDRTNIYLDQIATELDMHNETAHAMDLIKNTAGIFQQLEITSDQQAGYMKALGEIANTAEKTLNAINEQVEQINENLGFSENSDSVVSDDELLTNFIKNTAKKSATHDQKSDEIDKELEKRDTQRESGK